LFYPRLIKNELQTMTNVIMNPSQTSEIDISQLMEIICGIRPERYPFQRYVALMVFSTWSAWPDASNVVELAETVAAARLVLEVNRNRIRVPKEKRKILIDQISSMAFSTTRAAEALAEPCLDARFFDCSAKARHYIWDVGVVAAFFLKCPLDMKPSLNKAFYFIDEGGFSDFFSIGKGQRQKPYKISIASLKQSWSKLAPSSSFSCSAQCLNLEAIYDLPPDGDGSIRIARRLLKNDNKLKLYFGTARYIQDELLNRLDHTSRDKFPFVEFPNSIISIPLVALPFERDQLDLLKKYRAPKFTTEKPDRKAGQSGPPSS
jgi:hypothetical protein